MSRIKVLLSLCLMALLCLPIFAENETASPQSAPKTPSAATETTGIVALIKFKDEASVADKVTRATFLDLFNSETWSNSTNMSSVYAYFYKQSFGKYKFKVQITDYITMPNDRAYYENGDGMELLLGDLLPLLANNANIDLSQVTDIEGKGPPLVILYRSGLSKF